MRRGLFVPALLLPLLGCGQSLRLASPHIEKMTAPEICIVVVQNEMQAAEIVKAALGACNDAAKHRL